MLSYNVKQLSKDIVNTPAYTLNNPQFSRGITSTQKQFVYTPVKKTRFPNLVFFALLFTRLRLAPVTSFANQVDLFAH